MLEILKGCGKYPDASEALKIFVKLIIITGGRCLTMGQVIPEGPGARFGVFLSSLETSSSSMGVVRKSRGLSSVVFINSCGAVLFALRVICSVMFAM